MKLRSTLRTSAVIAFLATAFIVPFCSTAVINSADTSNCCATTVMDVGYRDAATKEFTKQLTNVGADLRAHLFNSLNKFKETFQEMVRVAENMTGLMFAEVYPKMEAESRAIGSLLFGYIRDELTLSAMPLPPSTIGQALPSAGSGASSVPVVGLLKGQVAEKVNDYFRSLFPYVYQYAINTRARDLTDDYKECLRNSVMKKSQIETHDDASGASTLQEPYGETPGLIARQLENALDAAKTTLVAMNLGHEIINATTTSLVLDNQCVQALTRMTFCQRCTSGPRAKPCLGLCLNVYRGCLGQLAELDQPWGEYVSSLERLSSGMIGSYNIENVLSSIKGKIAEAIMHAMENSAEITKRVKLSCGNPKRVTRSVDNAENEESEISNESHRTELTQRHFTREYQRLKFHATNLDHETTIRNHHRVRRQNRDIYSLIASTPSLYVRLQTFAHQLAQSRGIFANMADNLCAESDSFASSIGSSSSFASSSSSRSNTPQTNAETCWNGRAVSEYSSTIAGVGLDARRLNPEFKDTGITIHDLRPDSPSRLGAQLDVISSKLRQMKELISIKITSIPQSDSYIITGGASSVSNSDTFGSGSGDGSDDRAPQPGRTGPGGQPWSDDEDLEGGDQLDGSGSGDGHIDGNQIDQTRPAIKEVGNDIGFDESGTTGSNAPKTQDGSGGAAIRPATSFSILIPLLLTLCMLIVSRSSLNFNQYSHDRHRHHR